MAIVDGGNALGTTVASRATEVAIEMAREVGVSFVTVKNSNHFGACASFGWTACENGMILLSGGPMVRLRCLHRWKSTSSR